MAAKYDVNTHTHFTAPKATGEHAEAMHAPTAIVLVADGRVWFTASYALVGAVDGVKKESPYDDTGACVVSYPAEGCGFHDPEEADQISACIAADDEMLRNM
jgi:hypothetical protein